MTSPADEKDEPRYHRLHAHVEPASDEDQHWSTNDGSTRHNSEAQNNNGSDRLRPPASDQHLTVGTDVDTIKDRNRLHSPSATRERTKRLDDDLQLLQIERQISQQEDAAAADRALHPSRSRYQEPVDDFAAATNPLHETAATVYKPPENPTTNFARFFKKIHNSSWLIRYLTYVVPVVIILLVPLLIGALKYNSATVGGVQLLWFAVWLEIVWLTMWAGRILAKCLPWPIGIISSIFTNNGKKWRDMGKQLEVPATLFFWWLAIIISFYPTMTSHHLDPAWKGRIKPWEKTTYKVFISIFVGFILNFAEKIIIQLIAISFHLRTYADRIELNKFQIGSLVKLYTFSKTKIAMEDSEFEARESMPASGALTPAQLVKEAQKNTKEAITKFGDVAGRIAADFTGRVINKSNHPHQVILTLLSSTSGSQVLARRLYRTFAREETETVHPDDLKNAFDNDEEADAAFTMFDKDMNGDISMEELEAVCVEIGRERKAITASLKDLDSVISKLDDVLIFVVAVVTILVFISLISTSAAGVLTSAGSSVLALSWLFSATAQEFLQSIIFVFVKHPFDVGDRVTVYGTTGSNGLGDDYFVKEIALLYTEFKKMEGHVVQAPNSYLNQLFILNQRRSGGLAEAVPVCIKFGTTLEQIDSLRTKLLEFVRAEKREYQGNILTELREVTEVHSLTLNVVFFYKSNWQNELLRLQRRNKFICALMITMQECGIEGPRMRYPGQKESFPVYLQNVPHLSTPGSGRNGHPDNPSGWMDESRQDGRPSTPPFVPAASQSPQVGSSTRDQSQQPPSILRQRGSSISGFGNRARGESLAAMGRRVDFSLGMKDISASDMTGDVFDDPPPRRLPSNFASGANATTSSLATNGASRMRTSQDTARSTGRDSHDLVHVSSDISNARSRTSHKNRFFSRSRMRRGGGPDEQDDVETGLGVTTGPPPTTTAPPMSEIPERQSGAEDSNESSGAAGRGSRIMAQHGSRGNSNNEPIDPRTGLVSPVAYGDHPSDGHLPVGDRPPVSAGLHGAGYTASGALRDEDDDDDSFGGRTSPQMAMRSRTENWSPGRIG
ncbi:Mechanosensitive ion channel-domain-containing protein [Phyllosticta citribraziliensis]